MAIKNRFGVKSVYEQNGKFYASMNSGVKVEITKDQYTGCQRSLDKKDVKKEFEKLRKQNPTLTYEEFLDYKEYNSVLKIIPSVELYVIRKQYEKTNKIESEKLFFIRSDVYEKYKQIYKRIKE